MNPRKEQGFTLLELIVVITILGILASLVLFKTSGAPVKARAMKIKHDLQAIVTAAEMIQSETGRYPEAIEEMVNPTDENGSPLMGGLKDFPKDPWGHEYEYELINGEPQARCLGLDNTPGGEGEAADTTYPETEEYGGY